MTQDTQAGAGAQPAPAIQPEALRIAMHLRQRAQLSRPGNLDTLSASGANELERQHAELSAAKSEAKHWRTNHDNVVSRLRIFTQRPDIPKELADRLPWYRELARLQEVEAQATAKCLHQGADAAAVAALEGLLSLVRREAPQLSGKVLGDAESAIAALQAAPPAQAQDAPLAPVAHSGIAWRDCSVCNPPWTDDDSVRVIAITAEDDFGGVQLHDIRAIDFYHGGTEVTDVCTHWAYRDEIWPRAALPATAAPDCLTCSDHGAVGNILTAEPCPDCTPAPAAVAAVLQQAQRQAFIRGWDERGKAHDLAPAVTTDRFMRELLDVYFPPAAPAQEHATQLAGQALPADEFRGDTDSLVRNIVALLDLDAQGCLVPHGVGGHARGLLSAAASRLAASDQAQGCTRSHPHENMSPMCGLRTEIARLNHAAAIAQATAAPAQAQEDARDLEAEALRACRDLPEGWEIEIHLERGYGVVTVIDPQGNDDELPVEGTLFDALKETIDTAIRDDAARAAQGGAA